MTSAIDFGIGDVARASGIPVRTIRYYDEIGLISAIHRTGGKRRFDGGTVGRVNFIRRCRAAGFPLATIRALLDDRDGGWRTIVTDQLDDLRSQRDRLDATIATVEEFLECGCAAVADCPRAS